jgi:Ca2+-binding RTX toxin-like protein
MTHRRLLPAARTEQDSRPDPLAPAATAIAVAAIVVGTDGDDSLTGTRGDDTLQGLAGDDTLIGLAGDDLLLGEAGNDSLLGGNDADAIAGGPGNDYANGGLGDDTLRGDAGSDSLVGGAGDDAIDAGPGDAPADDNYLFGGLGNDSLAGGAGRDRLYGQEDDDALHGGDGDDTLDGGAGHDLLVDGSSLADNDLLLGGAGNDTLITVEGADTLDGGEGDDLLWAQNCGQSVRLTGGPGADHFSFATYLAGLFESFSSPVAAPALITDFDPAEGDRIDTQVRAGVLPNSGSRLVWRGIAAAPFTATVGQRVTLAGPAGEPGTQEVWVLRCTATDRTVLYCDRGSNGVVDDCDLRLEFSGKVALSPACFSDGTFGAPAEADGNDPSSPSPTSP